MSSGIWTQCGGRSNRGPLEARPWRVVEHHYRSSTWKLVDSEDEHRILEDLIDARKPPLPVRPGFEGLHWLLSTPFRYPPLPYGSRFSSALEPSLWYGSDALRTALAEDAYYRLFVNAGSAARLTPFTVPRAAFQAHVRTREGVDLTARAFAAHAAALRSPTSYAAPQQVGASMRTDGIEAFRFASARDVEGGTNVGVLSPRAFATKRPLAASQTWQCTVTDAGVAYEYGMATWETHFFPVTDFLVGGTLPSPAP